MAGLAQGGHLPLGDVSLHDPRADLLADVDRRRVDLTRCRRVCAGDAGCRRPGQHLRRDGVRVEPDPHLVAFIYREEYYDKESERAGIADIIIAKHRNGAIGDVELTFAKEYPKFLNYTSPERYS